MGKGGHGLPKVSPGPAMLYPSTPCGRVTCGCLPPSWIPHAVRLCLILELASCCSFKFGVYVGGGADVVERLRPLEGEVALAFLAHPHRRLVAQLEVEYPIPTLYLSFSSVKSVGFDWV
jgi:hypothetical protein